MRKKAQNAWQFHLQGPLAPALMACIAGLLLLCTANSFAQDKNPPIKSTAPIKDIRVLIDISGSMKKTDPNNLRQPAVKLFATLLPKDIYSGVWTFGQWVNMLIPHGIADKNWKSNVHKLASKINSSGLFTNIEEALRRSTWDWSENDPAFDRTLIILSDGVVDISHNSTQNSESRKRITTEILPRLANAGVKIHTIALSSLSDKELLQQLSTATNGLHETILTAEELDKVFMNIFDVSAPRDEIPLIDNKVKVDGSIKEITFLLYRKESSSTPEIISPSGDSYKENKITDNITWHSEKRYDLVTIKEPQPGSWEVNSSTDPDNRVLIVTDLRLVISRLPSDVLIKQKIPIYAHLESENKIIKRRDFLHFVRMSAKYSNEDKKGKIQSIKLKDNGKGIDKHKNDGVYSGEIKKSHALKKNRFELFVNGTTFKRKSTQLINVVEHPVIANITLNEKNEISISIIPYLSLVTPEFVRVTATHTWPDKKTDKYIIPLTSPSEWSDKILTNEVNGNHKISIQVTGNDANGNDLDFSIEKSDINIGPIEAPSAISHDEESHEMINNSNPEETTESWTSVIFKVLMLNILFSLLGFSAFMLWKKYKNKLLPPLCEETINA